MLLIIRIIIWSKWSNNYGKLIPCCDVCYDFRIKICSVRFHYYLFCSRREFMLFVCINPYWRQTQFPSWMMLVYYSNTTGTTGRSATGFPCGVLPFSSKCLLDYCCSIISVLFFLFLSTIVCLFLHFLFVTVLSVLWFTVSNYPLVSSNLFSQSGTIVAQFTLFPKCSTYIYIYIKEGYKNRILC
jgi:hypothetical protein